MIDKEFLREFFNMRPQTFTAPPPTAAEVAADIAACTAHRACHSTPEHDPANGKLHGYCIVCGVPWPCETASYFLRKSPSGSGPSQRGVE